MSRKLPSPETGKLLLSRDAPGNMTAREADEIALSILQADDHDCDLDSLFWRTLAPAERWYIDYSMRHAAEYDSIRSIDVRAAGLAPERRHFRLQLVPKENRRDFDVFMRDVTVEIRQRETQEIFELAIRHANDVVLVTDADPFDAPGPTITFVNDAIKHHAGWSPQELLGQTPRILQGPETDPETIRYMGQQLRAWRRFEVQVLNYHKDGTPYWNEISVAPLRGADGWYRHWVSVQRNVTERKRLEQLSFLALRDPLTGLANRMHVEKHLNDAMLHAKAAGHDLGVLVFDIDHFKQINDRFGHAAGDQVLTEISARVAEELAAIGMVGRMGGDEFIAIIAQVEDAQELRRIAARIQARLTTPIGFEMHQIHVTVTFGACLSGDVDENSATLIRAADLALTKAKSHQRKTVRMFDQQLREQVEEQRRLEQDMRHGLHHSDFDVDFQPQVRSHHHDISGCEILLRWNHPHHGRLNAGRFLDLALTSGLIEPLGTLVLERAAKAANAWTKAGLSFGSIAVNVDMVQLANPEFACQVLALLERYKLGSDCLTIEVVERVFLDGHNLAIIDNLERMRQAGITLDLDDFGTGHASLTHLKSLNLRRIKIDQSFVRSAESEKTDVAIIRAIVDLTNTLGWEVVAEGVETVKQQNLLTDVGCHHFQGYHIARPMPEHAMTNWLLANQH